MTLRTMWSVLLPTYRMDWQGVKAQCNTGEGGCFPIHFDSDITVDSRLVTMIYYFNDQWKAEQGGHLRLFPSVPTLTDPIDVEPLHDRCVIFPTATMLHSVRPFAPHTTTSPSPMSSAANSARRYCFSVWIGEGPRPPWIQKPSLVRCGYLS